MSGLVFWRLEDGQMFRLANERGDYYLKDANNEHPDVNAFNLRTGWGVFINAQTPVMDMGFYNPDDYDFEAGVYGPNSNANMTFGIDNRCPNDQ